MFGTMYEKRPLKRPRLGPPDVYPQEPKQKEDELTSTNVKHGFATMQQLSDEFGSARNYNITATKVGQYFNAIMAKKEELMTLPESVRKRQQINPKDNFWPATARSKSAIDSWFKDLAGTKPLLNLAKKAPNFNKKEEIFTMLCENGVTMSRAAWFIKLSSAYTVAVSEAKIKKRSLPDPTTEWTGTLIKFLKDQLPRLYEYYSHGPHDKEKSEKEKDKEKTGSLTPNHVSSHVPNMTPPSMQSPALPTTAPEDYKTSLKQWNYCVQLAKYLYEEGLLDRQEFLNWILELLDKMRSHPSDDGVLKLFLPLALQYLSEFVQSEILCRRLAFACTKKLAYMCNNVSESALMAVSNETKTDINGKEEMKTPINTTQITFNEYLNCPHHRDLILQLSSIIQVICIECPTSLVWCGIGEPKTSSILHGSPLDILPVPPSLLPMPTKTPLTNANLRQTLRQAEEAIRQRSRQAEGRWCSDKWQTSSAGTTTNKILSTLDALDRHNFEKMDTSNSLDTLYSKIFTPYTICNNDANSKENRTEYNPSQDAAVVSILCEWAVSCERWGEHRAMAVSWLLDKRQSDVTQSDNDAYNNMSRNSDDKDSVSSGAGVPGGVPIFQNLLMHFLDHDAPVLEDPPNAANRTQFTNLVHLFSELIRHDVFSHDAYMCTLISRGDLLAGGTQSAMMNNGCAPAPHSNKPATPANQSLDDDIFGGIDLKPKLEDHPRMDYDDSKIDADLDKLLQHIKEDQSMDVADSPKEPDQNNSHSHMNSMDTDGCSSRHLLYTTHFPLLQDDSGSQHDCNQRHILLYGVGKVRDEARHTVKKMAKEICKLFSKKFSIDVAEGGKVKKHSRNEFNFEATTQKCQNLSFFDQHVVTWQCSQTVMEMLNSFAQGNSNYLPVQEHVAFLFDLMEMALNIYGLIDVCIQILKELPEVESQLQAKSSGLVRQYTTSLSLYVVGVLRRYQCCLLLSTEQTSAVFEGLYKVVKPVTNFSFLPNDCSSAERCVLAHLYDLYSACSYLKSKLHPIEPFANAYPKIRQALYASLQPIPSTYDLNSQFMMDVLTNPRRGGKIEQSWARQLSESASNRYSFVCNAILCVCRETDNDRLNDIAITCAELTACCNTLAAEWLAVLMALCCSGPHNQSFYIDVLEQIDVQDLGIHNSLAVFTCILIARHCFSLEDLVRHVALPSFVKVCRGDTTSIDAEAGARLTCHLLLRLFKTVECPQPGMYSVSTSPHPIPSQGPQYSIKLSCDRHLLAAAHKNISVEPVLAVLKTILVVGDTTARDGGNSKNGGKRSGLSTPVHPGSTPKGQMGACELSHILGTSDMSLMGGADDPMLDLTMVDLEAGNRHAQSRIHHPNNTENVSSLSEFAQHVLREICSQEWVLERCLQNPDALCDPDLLLDNMLTPKQAQRLLHMICYPETAANMKEDIDQKSLIVRILENLEQWSLRMSWLELQLMYKQYPNAGSSELNQWLDMVARAAIDVFQMQPDGPDKMNTSSPDRLKGKKTESIWLVAPLVSKLPSAVQGRVLKVAGQVLESGNWCSNKSRNDSKGNGSSSSLDSSSRNRGKGSSAGPLLYHLPFLGLVLTCLKGQDEQREGLLTSLHSQLSQFLQLSKDERLGNMEDSTGREMMLDALVLRFSLVGGLFDTIQKNSTSTTDWALLLVQLICSSVIDLNNNSELFTTVIDMLATLIHSTLVTDNHSDRDEKKFYQNLMKKLKKEVGDRNNPSIQHVRQLLQLPKLTCEVIACEPVGVVVDTKGNKISFDKKQGLKLSDKQRISAWDLLEGHKNPAPLSWAWFGAVKMERKPLRYEEAHRLLKYHTHGLQKPPSHYLDPLPLPPEDLEPVPEKTSRPSDCCGGGGVGGLGPDSIMKADTPSSSSVDQSPHGNHVGHMMMGGPPMGVPMGVGGPMNQVGPGAHQMLMGGPPMMGVPGGPQGMMMMGGVGVGVGVGGVPGAAVPPTGRGRGKGSTRRPRKKTVQQQQAAAAQQQQAAAAAQQQQQQQQVGVQPGGVVGAGGVPGAGHMGAAGQQAGAAVPGMMQIQNAAQMQHMQYAQAQQGIQGAQQQQQQHPQNFPQGQQGQQQGQQQWSYPQTPMGQQYGYGPPQQVNRFERPQINQSKQALSNMLRQRQPMNQFMPGATGNPSANQFPGMGPRQQMIRQQLRAGMTPNSMAMTANQGMMAGNQGMNPSMNPGQMAGQNIGQMNVQGMGNPSMQGPMLSQNANMTQGLNPGMATQGMGNQNGQNMANQVMGGQNMAGQNMGGPQQAMFQNQQYGNMSQGMNQNYPGYTGQPGNQQTMMGGFTGQQQFANQQNPAMMNQQQRNTHAEYMAQRVNRGSYMQQQQSPNVTMSTMGGPAPPYPRGGKPGPQSQVPQFTQQMNPQQSQRIRQQMLAMQQQQQQVQQQGLTTPQQQGSPALVAQLQRQLNQPQQPMMGQYSHQPPPY